jgi:hypothetical protein
VTSRKTVSGTGIFVDGRAVCRIQANQYEKANTKLLVTALKTHLGERGAGDPV